jgi:hypothetical protein
MKHATLSRILAHALFHFAVVSISRTVAATPWDNHPENEWVKQSPRPGAPAPGFLYEGSGDFDPVSKKWIHHAGHDGIPQGFHTFTFDLVSGKWSQQFPPTSPPGVCCVDGSHTFDIAARRFVRFPGGSLGHGYQWSRGVQLKNSAVWLYDPAANTWTNMRPPPYQEPAKYSPDVVGGLCGGATYVPQHQISVSYGGSGAGGSKSTLFFYDAYANSFHVVKGANPPPARDGMALACDPRRDRLVMFGSQYLSDEKTWTYSFQSNRWESYSLEPHPPGKKTGTYSTIPKMAYDSLNDRMVCVAWLGETGGHETWVFHLGTMKWEKANPSKEPDPSKSRSRNLGYSLDLNLFIFELSSTNNRPEVWTYRSKGTEASRKPAAPTSLVIETTAKSARLRWEPSRSKEVTSYEILRANPGDPWHADFKSIATTTQTTFEDTAITAGSACYYSVRGLAAAGLPSERSQHARSQPAVPPAPIVSVRAKNRIEIQWKPNAAADITGYNIYRGVATVKAIVKGEPGAWKDNDPEYAEPQVVKITNISQPRKLNANLLDKPEFVDDVDVTQKGPESSDYRFAVYAYIVRVVNKLGVESGPSPYALTIPSEPANVLSREGKDTVELKWDANPESGMAGYRVYGMKGTWQIVPLTSEPIGTTTFSQRRTSVSARFWVTAIDAIGQEGQPSSPVWSENRYRGFVSGDWHQ